MTVGVKLTFCNSNLSNREAKLFLELEKLDYGFKIVELKISKVSSPKQKSNKR